jgi:hypothetical protein
VGSQARSADHTSTPAGDNPEFPVYNIPAALFHAFAGRRVILRTADPREPPTVLGPEVPERVVFIQLTALKESLAPLADWGEGLPLDLTMTDPAVEFPWLYRCSGLLARHPVRVTIPLLPGLARAIKLAVSLGFAVRLVEHQPAPEALEEARDALGTYLHNPTVSQPVEPFHSVLVAFLHDSPVGLWRLLEQDPAYIRTLGDRGEELSSLGPPSVTAFRDRLVAEGAECRTCEWLSICGGYFKWPRTDYGCTGVRQLFADLHAAAAELRHDLASYPASRGGSTHGV